MMIGPHAGEIRDVKPFNARQMIADGRALDPNAPIAEEVPVPVLKAEIVVTVTGKRGKSK